MPKTVNEKTLKDIEYLCSWIFETEGEDYSEFLANHPEHLPTPDSDPTSAEVWDEAAKKEGNDHVYALAARIWTALLKKGE